MNRKKLNISPVIFTLIVILSVTVAITESKLINFNIDADVDVNDHTRDQY